jgi:hypothetical protein
MDELDPESKALFDSARDATNPTRADRARITAGLSAKLGGAAFLATSGVSAGTVAKTATAFGTFKTLILSQVGPALLVGAALGGTATFAVYSQLEPTEKRALPRAQAPLAPQPKRSATAVIPAVPTPAIDNEFAEPAPPQAERGGVPAARRQQAESASVPEQAVPVAPLAEPSPAVQTAENSAKEASGLSTELQLIARMHAASRAGDWAAVDRAVSAHEQQFPSGALAEEREAIKTIAACRSVSSERAVELGSQFAARHAGSTYVARVKTACGAPRK